MAACELLHIDTKKLRRFWNVGKRILGDGVTRSPRAGWQHEHVAVDDHSRLACAEVLPSDRSGDALAFLERTLRWFGEQGITVEAVMTTTAQRTLRTRGERAATSHTALTRDPLESGVGRDTALFHHRQLRQESSLGGGLITLTSIPCKPRVPSESGAAVYRRIPAIGGPSASPASRQ